MTTRERIEQVRQQMEDATAKINPLIARAEAVFTKLGLSVEATVFLERTPPQRGRKGPPKLHSLCFREFRGRWRLILEACADSPSAVPSENLLEASSRRLRLLALSALPELHAALEAASSGSSLASLA